MPRQKSTHVDDPVAVGKRLRAAREATNDHMKKAVGLHQNPAARPAQ